MLVLRNPMDTETTATSGVHAAALFGPDVAAAPAAPVVNRVAPRKPPVVAPVTVAPPPPKIYTVEAIRAAKRTEEVVR